MALKDAVKISRKTFFNPRGWLGYDMLKTQFTTSWSVIKNLCTLPVATRTETFEQAQQRFQLSEEQLDDISKKFWIFVWVLNAFGVFSFLFSVYLLVRYGTFAGFVLGVATAAIFFAYAFRYSFWRFEIKHRKLGCTFKEWLAGKPSSHEGAGHD